MVLDLVRVCLIIITIRSFIFLLMTVIDSQFFFFFLIIFLGICITFSWVSLFTLQLLEFGTR
jgi:hypothetical protein